MNSIKLDLACLCDNAHMAQGEKLNIIGVFENIYAKKFPVVFPQMSFVSVFLIDAADKEISFNFKVLILEQGKAKPIQTFENKCKVKRKESNPNRRTNIIMNFQNVKFDTPDNYYIEVYVNEELVKTCNFKVVQV